MRRRDFNTALLMTLGSHGLWGSQSGNAATNSRELDQYGGWKQKKFSASGFFRVEHDDRWWLVTPEGNVFLSFGVNHLHSDLWRKDFNREAWKRRLQVDNLDDWATFAPALRDWFLKTCHEWRFNTAGVHTSLPVINQPQAAIPSRMFPPRASRVEPLPVEPPPSPALVAEAPPLLPFFLFPFVDDDLTSPVILTEAACDRRPFAFLFLRRRLLS